MECPSCNALVQTKEEFQACRREQARVRKLKEFLENCPLNKAYPSWEEGIFVGKV